LLFFLLLADDRLQRLIVLFSLWPWEATQFDCCFVFSLVAMTGRHTGWLLFCFVVFSCCSCNRPHQEIVVVCFLFLCSHEHRLIVVSPACVEIVDSAVRGQFHCDQFGPVFCCGLFVLTMRCQSWGMDLLVLFGKFVYQWWSFLCIPSTCRGIVWTALYLAGGTMDLSCVCHDSCCDGDSFAHPPCSQDEMILCQIIQNGTLCIHIPVTAIIISVLSFPSLVCRMVGWYALQLWCVVESCRHGVVLGLLYQWYCHVWMWSSPDMWTCGYLFYVSNSLWCPYMECYWEGIIHLTVKESNRSGTHGATGLLVIPIIHKITKDMSSFKMMMVPPFENKQQHVCHFLVSWKQFKMCTFLGCNFFLK